MGKNEEGARMSQPKYRATFSQRGDEIAGTINRENCDFAFVMECLHEQVVYLAKQSGIDPGEIVRDLYSIVTGKVK